MKAGRELDVLVAEKVMGYEQFTHETGGPWWRYPDGTDCAETETFFNSIAFSTNTEAAWQVVEGIVGASKHGVFWDIRMSYDGWSAVFYRDNEQFHARGETAPEAICLAALKAKGVEE